MVAPTGGDDKTTILPNGSPVRPKDTGLTGSVSAHVVHVRPREVAALTAAGYRLATSADLRAGNTTMVDVGWTESN